MLCLTGGLDLLRIDVRRLRMDIDAITLAFSHTVADDDARRSFDLLAGGLAWADETPPPELYEGLVLTAHRALIAYRASLVLGEPDDALRPTWQLIERVCPNWPGFLPDRRSPEHRATLLECLEADI